MHACTVVSRSHLAYARVLARSFREHHPGSTVHALVLDPGPGLPVGEEPFEIVTPGELFTLEEWGPIWFAYTVPELAFAAKPRLLAHLLDRFGGTATYLDSDIRFYGAMDRVTELSERHGVVLIPHTTEPLPADGQVPTELDLLRAGAYNLGFISVGQGGRAFLDWWWQHLQRQCLVELSEGLNGDQRWVDLGAVLFDAHAGRDPGWNVAYWNLGTRQLALSDGRYLVDGEPLVFFHFSGFDPHLPWLLSKHGGRSPRVLLSESPPLRRLCDEYASELRAAGHDQVSGLVMDQATLPNGVVLDQRARRVYRKAWTDAGASARPAEIPNPLTDPGGLVAWLREPARPGHPAWLSRYLLRLHRDRRSLVSAFPDVAGAGGPGFLEWVRRHGSSRAGIPAVLMPEERLPEPAGMSAAPVGEGVNLIGFLRAESGLGEAARQIVGAARRLGVPLATHTYAPANLAARQEHAFPDLRPVPGVVNPYDTNILCLNAPEVTRLAAELGGDLFRGRCTAGAWAWELEDFPKSWLRAFEFVDEVWMNSEFAARGLRKVATKPIRVFPLPVCTPVASAAGRSGLGLPDGFMFLFVFSYASVFERKNPDGLVRAFTRAFAPGEGPVLVVKSVKGELHRDKRERLLYAAAGRPDVILLEEYLSAGDKNALMALCDCYVSLHRSEGFGLTMAEAMALGKPTIATGYSGNLEFMTPENSFLVGFGEGRVPPGAGHYPAGAIWAEPDLDQAAALMRRVYEHPEEARRVGERARDDMARRHGPEARARLLGELLDQARAEWKARMRTASVAPASRVEDRPARASAPAVGSPGPDPGAPAGRPFRAERDLVWLLRRLEKPPLGWLLTRRKGFRKLRDRWLRGD